MDGTRPALDSSSTIDAELDHRVLRELVKHLQERPQVQNIDLMNTSGFCRNCLAKWRHKAAIELQLGGATYEQSLNYIYGMSYEEFKQKHQTKATSEQLQLFKESQPLHAPHIGFNPSPVPVNALKSSVCCEPTDQTPQTDSLNRRTQQVTEIKCPIDIKIGILVLSDRASRGEYEDKSGPIIQLVIKGSGVQRFEVQQPIILPDDIDKIEQNLITLSASHDVIFTTGGTGLGKRDVTPEATLRVIDRKLPGISEMLRRETAKFEPMSWLSRGEAGSRGHCAIINMPGHPAAAEQYTTLLLPLLPRIVELLRE